MCYVNGLHCREEKLFQRDLQQQKISNLTNNLPLIL